MGYYPHPTTASSNHRHDGVGCAGAFGSSQRNGVSLPWPARFVVRPRSVAQEAQPRAQASDAIAPPIQEPRYNERIRAREVRLVDADGSQVGIVSIEDALRRAQSRELDLVEVAPQASPPVCRIMDYGKFRYEESQRIKESRRKTVQITMKEVKFRPKIGKGDFDTKVRHMIEFLEEGHKVKVTLQFRGREVAHPELGRKILDAVLVQLDGLAKVDTHARLEGRNMTMVLSPDKKQVKKERADRPNGDGPAPTEPEPEAPTA